MDKKFQKKLRDVLQDHCEESKESMLDYLDTYYEDFVASVTKKLDLNIKKPQSCEVGTPLLGTYAYCLGLTISKHFLLLDAAFFYKTNKVINLEFFKMSFDRGYRYFIENNVDTLLESRNMYRENEKKK